MATVTVIFGGQEQQTVQLDKPRVVAGREPVCEIHIDNLGISRQHCAFVARGDAFLIQDLNSSNGTFVNGRKVSEHFLNNDDEVMIGKYTLKFKNEAQAAAPANTSDAPVPDTLNTYVMDGAKIQEQLARMRAQSGAKPEAAPATAKDYARALEAAPAGQNGEVARLKSFVIALAAVVVVLLAVIVLIMAGVFKVHP